ncbi:MULTISPECIES: phosphate ABC transporter substrate-binding/OmpA family protein [unclassified Epibacterium]|jgi:phosphate transport system substrate-binding protein|uniref:phosphate ABC transporter substrate-binding/OmpA family protein n=1 Tax=unclassified Epibacterium TaxID=2639179 RepID=UPI001EF43052|nr:MULTISPECIES: phosphate ABC transporter substrate-binding/OmpA family protein [unclassified Epibacterium]MCG7623812.1 phosphate ABC transporter substrate-binding/OmpA family protein [Epibacterium sp. Ofav1-8]MCG7628343.1 phosphate ABC transporter substrate-binding/OmpA family protein [Epibacterium sp. MM17-32]
MSYFRAAICAALCLFGAGVPVAGQDVTLSSPDGAIEVTGDLLGFDGEFYRVDTQFGELTVDGSGVHCDGPGCPSLSDFVAEITLSGSSTMAEVLLPALVEGFALRNGFQTTREQIDSRQFEYTLLRDSDPAARFVFLVSNTNEGFADLLADQTDIVMALREIRDAERRLAQDAGMGDMTLSNRARVLALDAMVPIVSRTNPVRRISLPQLADVYAGKLTNWKQLGGADAPISMHLTVEGSGLAEAVEDRLLAPAGLELSRAIRRHDRGSSLVRTVATDPFAIGIASYAETGTARMLTLTGSCGFSLSAGRRMIKTEDYPLTAPMFLYLPARRLPRVARDFLTYVRGPAAQAVIRRAGFVDQAAERIPMAAQGERLGNAIKAAGEDIGLDALQSLIRGLDKLQRLTLTFRFEAGSSRPDAQSRSNIDLLAREIEAGIYDNKRLVFVGFSDGEGPAEGNLAIALKRAEAVRHAVEAAAETANLDRLRIETQAYGETLPIACDDSGWGRQVNRRVEIWVE